MFNKKSKINIACHIRSMAEKNPDMDIITFENHGKPDEILTYGELVRKGNLLAGVLGTAGIGPGDTFSVVMKNQPEIVISLYAALATGVVMVPIDPGFGWEKLAYHLRHSDAKGVLFSEDSADRMGEVLSMLPELKVMGVKSNGDCDIGTSTRYKDLSDIFEKGTGRPFEPGEKPAGDDAMILYTSGTTGIPKGVRIRTETLYYYLLMAEHVFQYTKGDRLYTGLPLIHGNAYSVTVLPSLYFGIPSVISRNIDPKRIWDICRHYNCTTFSLLGGLTADIYGEPEQPDDDVNPVKKVIIAGTPRHIWKLFEQRFKVTIHEWYGTLEGGFAHNPPGVGPVGSFGKPVDAYNEMKVVGKNGNMCDPGETGELLYRFKDGKTMVEFQKEPATSSNKTQNSWFRTGDMVHQDESGWLFYDYRKGSGLRRHGEYISAQEVESLILIHPEVQEVCVYGIDAATGAPGEHDLVAAITPNRGITPDIRGIFEFCNGRLPTVAIPSYIQLVEAIPKTPTEKAIRRLLKEEFKKESPNVYQLND